MNPMGEERYAMTDGEIRDRLRRVRCFLLDMDGTFYLGDRLIDGSLDFLTNGEVYMLRHYVYGDAVFRVGNSTNVTFDGVNCSAVTVEGNEWVRSRYSPLSPFLAFKNAEAYYLFIK